MPGVRHVWPLLKETVSSWSDDAAPSMGAALAYYTLFSLAPLLLIVISVAGLLFGEQAARGEVMGQLTQLVGPESAEVAESMLQSVNKPAAGIVGTLLGIAILLVGATSVFAELQNALDRIWRAPARPNESGLFTLVRARVLSIGMILGIGFLLMVSLVVSAALSALNKWYTAWFGAGTLEIAGLLDVTISFAFITTLFAMIYKWMPRVQVAWRDVWVGAGITALLFIVGKLLIGLYIGRSGVASGFGAAASLVVLLLWVYYSAQIFLLGAEFTWVYARRLGSLKGRADPPPVGPPGVPASALPAPAPAPASPSVPQAGMR